MRENLKDKTAIVTGSGSGIGRAISRHLAMEGCNLILVGRKLESLEETKSQCEKYGVDVQLFPADLSDFSSIDALAAGVRQQIDIFVLNAGISQRAKALDTAFEVEEKIMKVDFLSGVYLLKAFKDRILAAPHVQIAVTSSISGLFGFPLRSSYAAAKHAMFGYYESLELEYPNIGVTFLIPGRINTQISKSALEADGTPHAQMDPGQAKGMDVDRCGAIAVRAIRRRKHRKLIGGSELLMVYIHKWCLPLYYKLSRKISAT